MNEKESLICLSTFVPFGPARLNLLLSFFGSAKKVWQADIGRLTQVGLSEKLIADYQKHRDSFDTNSYFSKLTKYKIAVITKKEPAYPENLKDLENAPILIYIKGRLLEKDSLAIAVVGSRKMTSYGREVTSKFSTELSGYGVTIISGLARGIDTVAHKSALESGGRTIAVLGSGLDRIYPPENTTLANEICRSGALISEYPLGYPAMPINFASRNRIISGLSKGVLVVEGAAKSGTLLTASHAAEQGRTVFAVPGQITSPLSAAPFFLINNGARMTLSTKDILEELNIEYAVNKIQVERVMPGSPEEEKILAILANESLHLDEVARISSLDTGVVSARLTIMELKGLVRNLGQGIYKKI